MSMVKPENTPDGTLTGMLNVFGDLWSSSSTAAVNSTITGTYTGTSTPINLEQWDFNCGPSTCDSGAIEGIISGVMGSPSPYTRLIGLYSNSSGAGGVVFGSYTGDFSSGAANLLGTAYVVDMGVMGLNPNDFASNVAVSIMTSDTVNMFHFNNHIQGANSPYDYFEQRLRFSVIPDWGIWRSSLSGRNQNPNLPTSGPWELLMSYDDANKLVTTYTFINSPDYASKYFNGLLRGSWADISSTPVSGIMVGETVGVFNASNYYRAIGMGVWMETARYLSMACVDNVCNTTGSGLDPDQQRLKDLKMPHVEVGRTNLSGALVSGSDYVSLLMNNVIFFANASGQKPQIWATSNINGSYAMATAGQINGLPIANQANRFTLSNGASSNPLTAEFQFLQWSSGKWYGSISSGVGTLSGGTFTGSIQFSGVGAGTYSGGTISGTGAGTVKP
jgi:hypothetical protein